MHEALFDDSFLKDTGVTTLDFAKAMIDEGYHPMTMYFPLVVHGAMLIEPTESRVQGDARPLHRSPARARRAGQERQGGRGASRPRRVFAPRRRLDETAGRAQAGAALAAVEQLQAGGGVGSWKRMSVLLPSLRVHPRADPAGPRFRGVVRSSMTRGTGAGLLTTIGVSIGLAFYATLSLLGLSAVLVKYQWLTWAVRVLGGAYLIYLGIRLLLLQAGGDRTTRRRAVRCAAAPCCSAFS